MQISHRYKFIFFSFPKTGSESVRELLDPFSDIHGVPYWERTDKHPFYSHISPKEIKDIFEQRHWRYDDYFRFTFVRNPWARLVSLYNMIYHAQQPASLAGKILSTFANSSPPTFKEWLHQTMPSGSGAGGPPDQRWRVYGSYSIEHYIFDEKGNALVDEIVKLEEIDTQLPIILEKIGIPQATELAIPYLNKRPSGQYTEYYDTETRDLVYKRYRYDIERFNYVFDDPD